MMEDDDDDEESEVEGGMVDSTQESPADEPPTDSDPE